MTKDPFQADVGRGRPTVPVHDDSVWDVDTLYVLLVVLRVGEQVQTVSRPVVFDLQTRCWLENGSTKGSGP